MDNSMITSVRCAECNERLGVIGMPEITHASAFTLELNVKVRKCSICYGKASEALVLLNRMAKIASEIKE
jgi:hypothetical protein